MGLNEAIARRASRGAHVLIAEVPGWAETRMLLEVELDRRGWVIALSPADADVLAVCGDPGDELRDVCERIWAQLPGPRARVEVTAPSAVSAALDLAGDQLIDDSRERQDARGRRPSATLAASQDDGAGGHDMSGHDMSDDAGRDDMGGHDMSGHDMSDDAGRDDMGGHDAGGHDMSDHDMGHGDHSGMGMDHGDMNMMMPAGIPLADGGDDRDGLEMDVLHVALGPVLPNWPAGLVVECVLQGDVVVSAEARVLAARSDPTEASITRDPLSWRVVRLLDLSADLLSLAGWRSAASQALRLRGGFLAGADLRSEAGSLDRLHRRVERSVLLRWSLRGIAFGQTAQGSAAPAGDVRSRLIGWLAEAADLADKHTNADPNTYTNADANPDRHPHYSEVGAADLAEKSLTDLREVIRGKDLGTARLLIAGSGLDTALIADPQRTAHD